MISPQQQFSVILGQMREFFSELSRRKKEAGEWSEADAADYGEAIRATVEGKVEVDDGVCFWWAWLRDQVTDLEMRRELAAGITARIKSSIAARRAASKAA